MDLREKPEGFSNNATARSVSMKNKRTAGKWKQLMKTIEMQKSEIAQEFDENRNKLLTQTKETKTRTVSLSFKHESLNEKPSVHSVCEVLMASLRKERQGRTTRVGESSVVSGVQRPTRSSEIKKVSRKNISLSLNELQKSEVRTTGATKPQSSKQKDKQGTEDLKSPSARRPRSAFDFTEEEKEISSKLYNTPMALPRIYLQKSFRPKCRSFNKDNEYRKKVSAAVDEESWKDIHHCRYLRIQPLRRSQTVPDLRTASMQ